MGLSLSCPHSPSVLGMPWAQGGLFWTLLNRGRGEGHKCSASRPCTPQLVHLLSLPAPPPSEVSPTPAGTHACSHKHTARMAGTPNLPLGSAPLQAKSSSPWASTPCLQCWVQNWGLPSQCHTLSPLPSSHPGRGWARQPLPHSQAALFPWGSTLGARLARPLPSLSLPALCPHKV